MNYLAHLFLSCEQESLLIGNFLADFLTKKEAEAQPLPIQQGITLHRKIDSFTDNHELVRESVRLLHSVHHKYAPVLLDIFYDYFLATNWAKFDSQPLDVFAQKMYTILTGNLDRMPPKMHPRVNGMVKDNWLVQYGTEEGLSTTFGYLKRRVSRPEHIEGAIDSLKLHHRELEQGFLTFFPELMTYVKTECLCL